jgi:hypothetical protein
MGDVETRQMSCGRDEDAFELFSGRGYWHEKAQYQGSRSDGSAGLYSTVPHCIGTTHAVRVGALSVGCRQ